jgi:hypothetical protein
MTPAVLHDAIDDVCPIISVTMGDPNDRETWTYDPKPEATPEQIAAADNVIATIPVETLDPGVECSEFIARFTNQEYLALEKKRRDDIAASKIGNAKNWDIVIAESSIDMNAKKTKSLKADLVADGVLTQARADEIFQ